MWKSFKIFEENKTQHINRCYQTTVIKEKTACILHKKTTNIKRKY